MEALHNSGILSPVATFCLGISKEGRDSLYISEQGRGKRGQRERERAHTCANETEKDFGYIR